MYHGVPLMANITFIGAGSAVFARNLLRDLFTVPELHESSIRLMDIDPDRLRDTEKIAHRVAAEAGASPQITATTDRREALKGADYVVNMIQVGGYEPATVTDFEIPKKYGLRQTIGDTLGIGGIMRGLRTIPVMPTSVPILKSFARCAAAQLLEPNGDADLGHEWHDVATVGPAMRSALPTAGVSRILSEETTTFAPASTMAFYLKLSAR